MPIMRFLGDNAVFTSGRSRFQNAGAIPGRPRHGSGALALGIAGFLAAVAAAGCGSGNGSLPTIPPPGSRVQQTNLVADTAGVAGHTDTHLVNAWGISFSATSPFWVSNNHTGTSTLYNTSGTPQALVVNIPGAPGVANGAPTGQVFNGTASFTIGTTGPASFIFATEDGVIDAWNGRAGTTAVRVADRSGANAIYKGLAIASTGGANFLYAADFHNGRIDRFDSNFQYVGSFTDLGLPAGYAPFNVQTINGNLYVTFAVQLGPDNEDDLPGAGNGFVDVFRPDGTLVTRLVSGGLLNSPWGLAIAPNGFGRFGGALLVGNFGDGRITAYDPNTGRLIGQLLDSNDAPITIPGLWALAFGNGGNGGQAGTLYFTAGPDGETHGLFGSLTPQ